MSDEIDPTVSKELITSTVDSFEEICKIFRTRDLTA